MRPHFLEVLADVRAHEFVFLLCRHLEGLQYDSYEEHHENCAYQQSVREKVYL